MFYWGPSSTSAETAASPRVNSDSGRRVSPRPSGRVPARTGRSAALLALPERGSGRNRGPHAAAGLGCEPAWAWARGRRLQTEMAVR